MVYHRCSGVTISLRTEMTLKLKRKNERMKKRKNQAKVICTYLKTLELLRLKIIG